MTSADVPFNDSESDESFQPVENSPKQYYYVVSLTKGLADEPHIESFPDQASACRYYLDKREDSTVSWVLFFVGLSYTPELVRMLKLKPDREGPELAIEVNDSGKLRTGP